MITPDVDLLTVLRKSFPDAKVGVGVGMTKMAAKTVITLTSTALPIGFKARGGKWVVDCTVLDTDRSDAFLTAGAAFDELTRAIDAGEVGDATGWTTVTLPTSVDQNTGSQKHSAVSFALQVTGHYGL